MSHESGGQGLIALAAHWMETLLAFLLAAFFGFLRYLQHFTATPRPPFEWLIATINALTAGSAGVAVGWAMREWQVGPNFTAFTVAVVGWGGAEFMGIFKEAIRDYLLRKTSKAADQDAAR